MRNVLALVLGGGRGTRLYPLTKYRSKPAVPLAGKYRLIDIPLSNCINSGLNRMYVLTQFNSVSLHRHIRRTYVFDSFSGGFVEILAAQQTNESFELVSGHRRRRAAEPALRARIGGRLRADSLRRSALPHELRRHARHAREIEGRRDDRHHAGHARGGPCVWHHAGRRYGPRRRVSWKSRRPRKKPTWCGPIRRGSTPAACRATGAICLASMGIYLFNRETLVDVLTKTDYHDFGKEVFPASMRTPQGVHAPVRRLLGRHWHDQIVLPMQSGFGETEAAVRFAFANRADLHPCPFLAADASSTARRSRTA